MAGNNKKSVSSPEEPKKLASSASSSRKSTSAVAKKSDTAKTPSAKKKSAATKENVRLDDTPPRTIHQYVPYILIVAAIFIAAGLLLSRFPGTFGDTGKILCLVLFGLFGWPAFFIPLILINLAVYWRKYVERSLVKVKVALSFGSLTLIGALVHVFTVGTGYNWSAWGNSIFGASGAVSNWTLGTRLNGGGFVGGLFGGFFRCATGVVGSAILLIALIIVCLMFMFSVTPAYIFSSIRFHFRNAVDNWNEMHEEMKRKEEEREKERRRQQRAAAKKQREQEARRAEKEKLEAEKRRAKEEEDDLLRRKKREDAIAASRSASEKKKQTEVPLTPISDTESASDAPIISVPGGRKAQTAPAADNVIILGAAAPAPVAPVQSDATDFSLGTTTEKDADVLFGTTVAPVAAPVSPDETAQQTDDPGSLLASIFDDAAFSDGKRPQKSPRRPAAAPAPAADDAAPVIPMTEIADDGNGILTDAGTEAEHPDAPAPAVPDKPQIEPYVFPFPELLHEIVNPGEGDITTELNSNAQKLMTKLAAFKVKIQKIEYSRGPTITRYELYPDAATRVRSIANLADDIALELATSVRIEAPIPNKQAVGIEVPNRNRATVFMRELVESEKFRNMPSKLSACLGKDVGGNMVFIDIAKTPHLLIAGTTGSGKSVCINSIILSILYKSRPDEVQFIMIDPKKIEMSMYNDLPHMKVPVVTDMKKAAGTLNAAVNEMEHRYEMFEEVHTRDLDGYNRAMSQNDPTFKPVPKIVIIIDELADLMMTGPAEVEDSIARLAQKARAAGIHLIVGTQRPSVNVITGVIKANIPTRIAFMVASNADSRVIIDQPGAEKLIGKGDMLYSASDNPKPKRVQGAFVADDEVEAVTNFIKERNCEHGEYDTDFMEEIDRETERLADKKDKGSQDDGEGAYMFSQPADELFAQALGYAVENGTVATSFLQRKLSVGFGRAGKIIDRMEALGFVSPANGTKPRNVLLTQQQLYEMKMNGDPRVNGNFNE